MRAGRLNSDIEREVAALLREVKDPRVSPLLSVVKAEVAGDLSQARIYVSAIGGREETERSVEGLRSAAGFLRRELGARVRLRRTPELIFIADDSIQRGAEITEKLRRLETGEE